MRTITVREAAKALNLTKRAIMYRLEGGKLKGTRIKNEYGAEEWRIYPNKEIIEGLQKLAAINPITEPTPGAFTEEDFSVDDVDFAEAEITENHAWHDLEKDKIKAMAEQFMAPLLERMESQTRALMQREMELSELKVRLLPDLEKRAEEERKAAELKQLEVVALNRQIESLKEAQSSQKAALSELEQAAQEAELLRVRKAELEELVPDLQDKLEKEAAERTKLEAELKKLQAEAKKPWWKKLIENPKLES